MQTVQNLINELLEGLGSGTQAEKHPEELKQSKADSDGCLGDVDGSTGIWW